MFLSSSDTGSTLRNLFFFYIHCPERTGFNMYAESTQQQLTFLALVPCLYLPVCGWADISVWKHWFLIIVVAVLTSCITLEYFTGVPTKNKKVKTMLNYSNMTFSRLFLVFCYGYSNFIVLLKWLGKERNTFTVPGNPKYKETYIFSSRES